MRFASLGSGSEGNAWIVESGPTRLMVDCGFSVNETVRRLSQLQLTPENIQAVLVTHEHADHLSGVVRFARRYRLPVYASFGTLSFCRHELEDSLCYELFSDQPMSIADIEVCPFLVPHDAREPLQFVFDDGLNRLGIVTDVGHVTSHMVTMLKELDALVLETNHDEDLLLQGHYPPALKARVMGEFGHLSNRQALALLKELNLGRLQRVVAAHLSQTNNHPQLVHDLLLDLLKDNERFLIASQSEGLSWVRV